FGRRKKRSNGSSAARPMAPIARSSFGRCSRLTTSAPSSRRSSAKKSGSFAHKPRAVSVGEASARRGESPFERGHGRPAGSVADTFRHRGETRRRSSPAKLVYALEQRSVGSQRRECFEEKSLVALIAQHVGRKVFDVAVPIDEARRCFRAALWNSGIAVGGI